MDHAELANLLTNSDDMERQELLSHRPELIGVDLAWMLKSLYDDIESSDPARAAQVSRALLSLSGFTDNSQVRAIAAWTEGMVTLDYGQMETAISHLDVAETMFLTSGLPVRAAATQVSKLRALAMLGRFDEALECGLKARDLFLAHNDVLATGKIEQNLGNLHFLLDHYVKAEQHYRAARGLYDLTGDQKQLAQIDNCLATTLTSQYRFREAEAIYEAALSRAQSAGLEITLAEIETNQGCLALFRGHYDRALDYLERSRRRYEALGMPHNSAIADQELADAYLELNLAPEAAAIYERVVPIFSDLGMQAEQARALAYHGRARLALGQITAARSLLAEARILYEAAGNAVGQAVVTLIEAQIYYVERDYAAASESAQQTEAAFAEVHAWGRLLLARWLQGEAARVQRKFSEADKLLRGVLRDAEQWAVLPVIHRCHTSLGLLAEDFGDMLGAERAFKRAIAAIEGTRAPLPAEEFRTAFMADKLIPYAEMARLCLEHSGQSRVVEALGYVEQSRSRALLDMLGGAMTATSTPTDRFEAELLSRLELLREELNWFYSQINRPDSDAASRGATMMAELYNAVRERETQISEIILQLRQRNTNMPIQAESFDVNTLTSCLGDETTLVEYFNLDDEYLAFVVNDQGIEVVRLLATKAEVEVELRQFHFQLGTFRHGAAHVLDYLPELTSRACEHLSRLYALLLRPIEGRLKRRLLVVPHGILHYVPFHALHDGSGYVVEQREVCSVPSASVLQHCLSAQRRPVQRATLLGISDVRNPRVRDEIHALAPLFPESTMLLDDQASYASLKEHSIAADVLHLACHGHFRPDNPMFSSLQLSDGWLTVRDAYHLNLRCELVTLSACETGVSAVAPGDEWIGLARSFFSAGAPSLLVSQWKVDDEATAKLMMDFYSRLQAGAGPAAALRYAQCQLMQHNPHPYFWAPFVILGRW